jgi:hypothetical protein
MKWWWWWSYRSLCYVATFLYSVPTRSFMLLHWAVGLDVLKESKTLLECWFLHENDWNEYRSHNRPVRCSWRQQIWIRLFGTRQNAVVNVNFSCSPCCYQLAVRAGRRKLHVDEFVTEQCHTCCSVSGTTPTERDINTFRTFVTTCVVKITNFWTSTIVYFL